MQRRCTIKKASCYNAYFRKQHFAVRISSCPKERANDLEPCWDSTGDHEGCVTKGITLFDPSPMLQKYSDDCYGRHELRPQGAIYCLDLCLDSLPIEGKTLTPGRHPSLLCPKVPFYEDASPPRSNNIQYHYRQRRRYLKSGGEEGLGWYGGPCEKNMFSIAWLQKS